MLYGQTWPRVFGRELGPQFLRDGCIIFWWCMCPVGLHVIIHACVTTALLPRRPTIRHACKAVRSAHPGVFNQSINQCVLGFSVECLIIDMAACMSSDVALHVQWERSLAREVPWCVVFAYNCLMSSSFAKQAQYTADEA